MAKLIRYKGKVTFDYFVVWHYEEKYYDYEVTDDIVADSVMTQACPWCVKKYGLYHNLENSRTPENIDEEIAYYESEPGFNPQDLDFTCDVAGCYNGAADYVWLDWDDCELIKEDEI